MAKELKVGDKASVTHTFTEDQVKTFAEVSTDKNPLHLDEAYAADTIFGERIVHGMFVGSLFSALIGMELPGEGTIYMGQSLSFKRPVKIGETVKATVEVIAIKPTKPIATLRTFCENEEGKLVIDGEAIVKFRD